MNSEDKPIEFVMPIEEDKVSRRLISWLNTYQDIPILIDRIDYEFLKPDLLSMSLSTVQSAYVAERFINGSYIAEYQFKIIYRVRPDSPDTRLKADEVLDGLGDWASGQTPNIGQGLEVQELEQTTRSALFAQMEGGWEDHQIFMRMTYKVYPGK